MKLFVHQSKVGEVRRMSRRVFGESPVVFGMDWPLNHQRAKRVYVLFGDRRSFWVEADSVDSVPELAINTIRGVAEGSDD